MITTKNKFAEVRQRLISKGRPTDDPEVIELEQKSRELAQEIIDSHKVELKAIDKAMKKAKGFPSITSQYKEICSVYKQATSLVLKVRASKKKIREEVIRCRKAR